MQQLLIIGASVRATCQSAVRAGFDVTGADLFADRDTVECCSSRCVSDYPNGFLELRNEFSGVPVVYTGALENYPALITHLAEQGPVWGNRGEVLEAVRDPLRWTTVLREHGIPCPAVAERMPTGSDRWLVKSRRSAGGQHVSEYRGHTVASDSYLQEFVVGTVASAAFVAVDGVSHYLGATDMLVGCPWLGASGFAYAGSVLRRPTHDETEQWKHIGRVLANAFELRGAFGVDAILRHGEVLPIEVNPRITSSMEVHELANSISIAGLHVAAFRNSGHHDHALEQLPTSSATATGKAILYATRQFQVPVDLPRDNPGFQLADIPNAGLTVLPGQPVASLIVTADTPDSVVDALKVSASVVQQRLAC